MSQQPPQPLKLYSKAEIRYKSGRTVTLEMVVFQVQVMPSGVQMLFEQPQGDRVATFVNFAEVEHVQLTPSKLEL